MVYNVWQMIPHSSSNKVTKMQEFFCNSYFYYLLY